MIITDNQMEPLMTDHVWRSPEELYRAQYFEVIDLMVRELDEKMKGLINMCTI